MNLDAACFIALEDPPGPPPVSSPRLAGLGRTGIITSTIALGCTRLGSPLTLLNRRQSIELIHEALDLGIRHFDTAGIYGQADSERYLGAALKGRRQDVCIATKAGRRLSPMQAMAAKFRAPIRWFGRHRSGMQGGAARQWADEMDCCFDPDYIVRSIEGSLRRLQTDFIDIFYLHSPNSAALSDERLLRLGEQLRRDGKIRCFGVSCGNPSIALAAARLPEVQAVQFEIDDGVWTAAILATAQRNGKAAVVRGMARRAARQGGGEAALEQALRAALGYPAVCGVIVDTTNIQRLRSNVSAFNRAISGLTREKPLFPLQPGEPGGEEQEGIPAFSLNSTEPFHPDHHRRTGDAAG
jgi:aryl-alcohol dehydrogenase-like predicted oxidoreductase